MTIRASLLVLVLAAFVPAVASAQATQAPSPESIAAMLSGVEDAPSLDAWRAMGPAVVPVLARLADDAQQPGYVRIRAIQAASAFSTEASRALLRRAMHGTDAMMQREATIGMARAFGRGAIADIAPMLAAEDTAVREGAIRAMGSIDDDAARARLRARLDRERDAGLRQAIQQQLSGGVERSGGVGAARDG